MSAPDGALPPLSAARDASRRIAGLFEETGLSVWWRESASPAVGPQGQVEDEPLQLCLRFAAMLVAEIPDRHPPALEGAGSSVEGNTYLRTARATGNRIVELIRERDEPWWRSTRLGAPLYHCLQVADFLASASSADEAEQLTRILRQEISHLVAGGEKATGRLAAARLIGRQVARLIHDAGLVDQHHRTPLAGPVQQCLTIAYYLADADNEAEAELMSKLLRQAVRRYSDLLAMMTASESAASAPYGYPHSERLSDARAVGRQLCELLRRSDLSGRAAAMPARATFRQLLDAAERLSEATSEADAVGSATLLAQTVRRESPTLQEWPDLYGNLRTAALQMDRIAFGFVSAGRYWVGGQELTSVRQLPPVVRRTTHMYLAAEQVSAAELVRRWVQSGHDPGRVARLLLRCAVAALPAPAQERYAEEYGAELWSLRDQSAVRRVHHALRLARNTLRLRSDLRAAGITLWTQPPEREP
jgi:hypothetical protein